MSSWLIAGVGVVYLIIGIKQFLLGNSGMGITFTGYAASNVGLYILAKGT